MNEYLNVTDVVVKFEDKVIGCLQSLSLKLSRASKEITCAASGPWSETIMGQKSWSASAAGVQRLFTAAQITADDEVTQDELFDRFDDGAKISIEYSYAKTGFVGSRYTGSAYVSGLTWDRPATDEVTWSAELTGTGALTRIA